jgi:hypothetical protein
MDIKPPQKPIKKDPMPLENNLRDMFNEANKTNESFQPKNDYPKPNFNTNYNNQYNVVKSKKKLSKKAKIIIFLLLFVIIGSGIAVFYFLNKQTSQVPVASTNTPVEPTKKEEPPKFYSPLTGIEFANEEPTKRPVTAVMVENSPSARPQSGLEEADMVFEAIAEAGVTRFMAVYQESAPTKIGPVRSARPYYLDYALWLDASYGHVGGSPDALQDIKKFGVKDLDEFANASSYWRATDRYAPHNAYTSIERLSVANQKKGYNSSDFKPLEHKIDVPQTPKVTKVDFAVSGPNYSPTFSYDPATNSYLRSQAGSPHKDAQSGKQINPKVVIALITKQGTDSDGYHTNYQTVGSGKLFVFQDGIVSEGTWSKNDRASELNLTDQYGLPLKINAGKTWITLLGSPDSVRYSN